MLKSVILKHTTQTRPPPPPPQPVTPGEATDQDQGWGEAELPSIPRNNVADDSIKELASSKQAGYLKTSLEMLKICFRSCPGYAVGTLAIHLHDAVQRVAPIFLLSNLITQMEKSPISSVILTASGYLGFMGVSRLVDSYRTTVSEGFRQKFDLALQAKFLKEIARKAVDTHTSPEFTNLVSNIRDNLWRGPIFVERNLTMVGSLLGACLAGSVAAKGFPMFVIAFVGVGLLELFHGIRKHKAEFEAAETLAPENSRYWYERFQIFTPRFLQGLKNYFYADTFIQNLSNVAKKLNDNRLGLQKKSAHESAIRGLLPLVIYSTLISTSLLDFYAGRLSDPKGLFNAVMMFYAFERCVSSFFSALGEQSGDSLAAAKYLSLATIGQPDIIPGKNYKRLNLDKGVEIKLKDISLVKEATTILSGLNYKFKSGQVYVICGASGSGKTSFFNLLTGLQPPTNGNILINGHHHTDVHPDDLRLALSYVDQQDIPIESYTVHEFINIGRPEFNQEAFDTALEIACVNFLGQGDLHRPIHRQFGGSRDYSGGEKARMLIARAVYSNPKAMILDEPMAALDPIKARSVLDNLTKWAKPNGKMLILISHDYSSLEAADKILFLEGGRLVETGTYEQLMEKRGRFYNQVNATRPQQ